MSFTRSACIAVRFVVGADHGDRHDDSPRARSHARRRPSLVVGAAAVASLVATTVAFGGSGAGTITVFAGSGPHSFGGGFSGDGGPATRARLNQPKGVAVDAKGNVYIADSYNHRVRKVSPSGKIQTIAGNGDYGSNDARGDGGPATSADLNTPIGMAVDAKGNVYIDEGSRIRRVDPSGTITTYAGGTCCAQGDGGPATSAWLNLTNQGGVAVDAKGNVYFSEATRVRKVDTSGTITTLAGTSKTGFSGDGGAATSAMLNHPTGLAVDRKGNLYIADSRNNRVRKVSPGGKIVTIAGTGKLGPFKDGVRANSAPLVNPVAVAVDLRGNIYIAATGVVFVVNPRGRITRFAGNGGNSGHLVGDGGPARSAELNGADGVAVDAKGNVYIADRGNHRVRKVRP